MDTHEDEERGRPEAARCPWHDLPLDGIGVGCALCEDAVAAQDVPPWTEAAIDAYYADLAAGFYAAHPEVAP